MDVVTVEGHNRRFMQQGLCDGSKLNPQVFNGTSRSVVSKVNRYLGHMGHVMPSTFARKF
jgi:hypothetical protein